MTAICAWCGKRLTIVGRARPRLHRHRCQYGHMMAGTIVKGSERYSKREIQAVRA